MRPSGHNTVSLAGDISAIGDTEYHGSVQMRPVVIETAPGKDYSMTVEVMLLDETVNDSNLVSGRHVYLQGYVCGKWRWNADDKAEYQNLIYITAVSTTPPAPTTETAKPTKTKTAKRHRRVIYDGQIYDSITALSESEHMDITGLYRYVKIGWYKGRPLHYEGDEQKPMPKSRTNRGRRVMYGGTIYTSIPELAAALKINIECIYNSLKRGWYKGKSIHYEGDEPKPRKHMGRKSTIHIVYDGREYRSARELAKAVGGTIGGIHTVRYFGSHTYLGKEIRFL